MGTPKHAPGVCHTHTERTIDAVGSMPRSHITIRNAAIKATIITYFPSRRLLYRPVSTCYNVHEKYPTPKYAVMIITGT